MPLKLTIVGDQRAVLGAHASIVLGTAGGSIGRGRDNDWVLSDPHCYLSAHHARVQFRLGTYYLLDTSSNGVYVNGGRVPIGRRNIYPLREGDRLRLGEYQIVVHIEADAEEAPEASSIYPMGQAADYAVYQEDIGAAIDVQDLLRTITPGANPTAPPGATSSVRVVDVAGRKALIEDTGLLAFDRGGRGGSSSGNAAATAAASTLAELRALTRMSGLPSPSAPSNNTRAGSEPSAIEAFCRGAGLDVQRLPPDGATRLLHRAGLLLREALVGLKGLALAQRELRAQAGIELKTDEAPAIELHGLSVEDLLLRLLSTHEPQGVDGVQWLRSTASSTHRHDRATARALALALGEFIARLDPRTLSQSIAERTASDAGQDSSGLTARFRSITDMSSGALPQLFAEAFAHAFSAEYQHDTRDQSGA